LGHVAGYPASFAATRRCLWFLLKFGIPFHLYNEWS